MPNFVEMGAIQGSLAYGVGQFVVSCVTSLLFKGHITFFLFI